MRHLLIPPTVVVLLLAGATSVAPDEPDSIEFRAQARLVRMPVLLDERSAGGCEGVQLDEIEITEDGVEVEPTQFENRRLPAIHAILVDTGFEMLDALHDLRQFGARYVDELPPDELAMLATFDDDMVLRAPLSTNRRVFVESLDWIEPGWGSALWSASRQMIQYLASRPERKVLVLLTDGCHQGRAEPVDPATVVAAAAEVDSLLVFPVWLNRPKICKPEWDNPAGTLKELAARTGGEFHDLESPDHFHEALEAIRERTERERYVTYKPLRFGKGPRDKAAGKDFRWRRRSIRFRTERKCKISIAGPPLRYESPQRRYPPSSAPHPDHVLIRPFALADTGDRLNGTVRDLVQDSGFLASGESSTPSEFFSRDYVDKTERRATHREVVAPVPAVARVTREITSPEAALTFALELLDGADDGPLAPVLVHGSTLLDVRASFAAALAGRPDYLDWARDKVKTRRLDEIDEIIAITEEGAELEQLKQARGWLAQLEWEPEPLELQTHLAGWLGDVTLMQVSNRLEARFAAGLLAMDAKEDPDAVARAARVAEIAWTKIVRQFPPPTEVRVIGLLVPAYDPDLDTIGFYRVLLRAPMSSEIGGMVSNAVRHKVVAPETVGERDSVHARMRAMNFSEDEPLGIRLAAWLREMPAIAPLLAPFRVEMVSYANPTPRDLYPTFESQGFDKVLGVHETYLAREITLLLSPIGDPGERTPVSVYFPRVKTDGWHFAHDPVCVLMPAELPGNESSLALLRTVATTQLEGETPCLLQTPKRDGRRR